jgi:hypothetical protein
MASSERVRDPPMAEASDPLQIVTGDLESVSDWVERTKDELHINRNGVALSYSANPPRGDTSARKESFKQHA